MMYGLRIGMLLHGDGDVTDRGFVIVVVGWFEVTLADVDICGGRVTIRTAFQCLGISRVIVFVIVGIAF